MSFPVQSDGPTGPGTVQTSQMRALVGGSGIILLKWAFPGQGMTTIGFARNFVHRVPKPVAAAVDVQPLDQIRPVEVVTAYAQGRGEIDITLYQLYNFEAWQRLAGLKNSQDFTDVARTIAKQTNGIVIERWVNPIVPNHNLYKEQYFNCVCTTLGDDDQVAIETMLMNKTLTFAYSHAKKDYINNGAFQFDSAANAAVIN